MDDVMKMRILNYTLIGLIFIFVNTFYSYQEETKYEILTNTIVNMLNMRHYSPPEIDDSLSIKFYNNFLKKIDPGKRFITKEDIAKLEKHKFSLDDAIKAKNFSFFNEAYQILDTRIAETKTFYKDLLKEPFDFKKTEYFELDPQKSDFAKDLKERKELWRKLFKYEVLTRIADQLEVQEKARQNNDTSVTIKSLKEIEKEEREKVQKRWDDFFIRIAKITKEDRFNDYINAFTEIFDPHTQYFPPKDKEDFDINMSGSLEGIGAQLSQRDEYIRVERIIPGSPAWKQGELKEGDIILKVAQGDGEPVDVVNMRLDDAVRLIRGKKGTEARLTVRKVDGSIKVIPIIRDIIQLEETFAKSIILENNNQRFGYIKLPSFYADFNDRYGRRSSLDMKQELIKLKNENINGLVLDLRNNGGGSLDDVIDIAGLFIKTGPIVQVNSRYGAPQIRQDFDPNVYYSGPLVILVNSVSASASEILAAAMQDYKRAIIIGSEHTFGKGTVQAMLDLDQNINPKFNSLKPFGALKLTIQKFYRINGGSTQLKGVEPDVILPDSYMHTDIGEKSYDYALPWTSIQPANYEPMKLSSTYFDKVIENSRNRVKNDKYFSSIEAKAKRLKEIREKTLIPLNYDEFLEDRKLRKELASSLEETEEEIKNLIIKPLQADLNNNENNESQKDRDQAWYSSVKKDNYIREALNVLTDMNDYLSKR